MVFQFAFYWVLHLRLRSLKDQWNGLEIDLDYMMFHLFGTGSLTRDHASSSISPKTGLDQLQEVSLVLKWVLGLAPRPKLCKCSWDSTVISKSLRPPGSFPLASVFSLLWSKDFNGRTVWPWPKFIDQMARDSVHNNISSYVINSCLSLISLQEVERSHIITMQCKDLDQCVRFINLFPRDQCISLITRALVFIWTLSLSIWAMNLDQGHTVLPLKSFDQSNESTEV